MHKTPAHVTISWVFLILIGIVFGYSYFFYPNSHPIPCMVKEYTGKDCATCGFSRSFSCYSHLQFNSGKSLNPNSWPVFLYLCIQFFLRAFVIFFYSFSGKRVNSTLLKTDILISISGFLLAFLPILFKN